MSTGSNSNSDRRTQKASLTSKVKKLLKRLMNDPNMKPVISMKRGKPGWDSYVGCNPDPMNFARICGEYKGYSSVDDLDERLRRMFDEFSEYCRKNGKKQAEINQCNRARISCAKLIADLRQSEPKIVNLASDSDDDTQPSNKSSKKKGSVHDACKAGHKSNEKDAPRKTKSNPSKRAAKARGNASIESSSSSLVTSKSNSNPSEAGSKSISENPSPAVAEENTTQESVAPLNSITASEPSQIEPTSEMKSETSSEWWNSNSTWVPNTSNESGNTTSTMSTTNQNNNSPVNSDADLTWGADWSVPSGVERSASGGLSSWDAGGFAGFSGSGSSNTSWGSGNSSNSLNWDWNAPSETEKKDASEGGASGDAGEPTDLVKRARAEALAAIKEAEGQDTEPKEKQKKRDENEDQTEKEDRSEPQTEVKDDSAPVNNNNDGLTHPLRMDDDDEDEDLITDSEEDPSKSERTANQHRRIVISRVSKPKASLAAENGERKDDNPPSNAVNNGARSADTVRNRPVSRSVVSPAISDPGTGIAGSKRRRIDFDRDQESPPKKNRFFTVRYWSFDPRERSKRERKKLVFASDFNDAISEVSRMLSEPDLKIISCARGIE